MSDRKDKELSGYDMFYLDDELKKREKTELPEALSPENIKEKLLFVPQYREEPETKEKKTPKQKRKIAFRVLASAAAFAVAVTSVMLVKPWEKFTQATIIAPDAPTSYQAEGYEEIEELFGSYAENYKRINYTTSLGNKFNSAMGGVLSTDKAADTAVPEGSIQENGSAMMDTEQSITAGSATDDSATESPSSNHGETNEQVQGVSEADIVKNDGRYIYAVKPDNADWESYYDELYSVKGKVVTGATTAVSVDESEAEAESETEAESEENAEKQEYPVLSYDCGIYIAEPQADGKLKKAGEIIIGKPQDESIYYMELREMYVKGDTLLAILNCWERKSAESTGYVTHYSGAVVSDSICVGATGGIYKTLAVCFDITDRGNPTEKWRFYQDGGYISSRLIGNEFVLLSEYFVDLSGDEATVKAQCVPCIAVDDKEASRIAAEDICIMEEINDSKYLVASATDIQNSESRNSQAVLGGGNQVYCTSETLYVTSTKFIGGRTTEIFGTENTQSTQICKFDIRNSDIRYLGSAAVKGYALNQFSMDEYEGNLRIATTTGSWGESLENQLYILDKELNVIGSIENIAKGETIKAVRFTGATGYVVTFEQTDPLFVIDLSEPANPQIKGELKIPGYSAYLHPIGENLMVGFGVDGDENGAGMGLKVSLFDVSNPEKPTECSKYTLSGYSEVNSGSYVESPALYDHKAFCADMKNGVFFFPAYKEFWVNNNYYTATYTTFVEAVKVDYESKSLSQAGTYLCESTKDYCGGLQRTTYMENLVFAISDEGTLYSFDRDTAVLLDSVQM